MIYYQADTSICKFIYPDNTCRVVPERVDDLQRSARPSLDYCRTGEKFLRMKQTKAAKGP